MMAVMATVAGSRINEAYLRTHTSFNLPCLISERIIPTSLTPVTGATMEPVAGATDTTLAVATGAYIWNMLVAQTQNAGVSKL